MSPSPTLKCEEPFIAALSLGLVLLITFRKQGSRLLLAVPHNAAWMIAFAIYASGLLNYYALSARAWGIMFAAIILFNVVIFILGKGGEKSQHGDQTGFRPLVTPGQYAVLSGFFVFGWAVYLIVMSAEFGLATLLNEPATVRGADTDYLSKIPFPARLMLYLGPLIFVFSVIPDFLTARVPGLARALIVVVIVVAYVSMLQRTNLFLALLWAIGLLLLKYFGGTGDLTEFNAATKSGRSPSHRLRAVASVAGIVLVAAISFQVLAVALEKTGTSNESVYLAVDPAIRDSEFIGVLSYASNGPAAFGNLVESTNDAWPPERLDGTDVYGDFNPQTWCLASLGAFARFLPTDREWNDISPFISTPIPTNVYTWLEPWYRDFRLPGVLLGTIAIGVVMGTLYRSSRGGSPAAALVLGLFLGNSALVTFVNQTTDTQNLFGILVVLLLGALGKSRDRRATRS